jgi:hypothetical protein
LFIVVLENSLRIIAAILWFFLCWSASENSVQFYCLHLKANRKACEFVSHGKIYKPYLPEQDLLLPPSLRDWLAENHLAYCVADVADQLDLSAIEGVIETDASKKCLHWFL